jgi:hypothetical protein
MAEIQKADPNVRRAGLGIVGAGAILGVLLMSIAASFRPDFEAWVRQDFTVRVRMVMMALTLLTAGPALGMAGYLWHLGNRIIRAERYPPPGLRVVRDTLVVSARAAHAGIWRRDRSGEFALGVLPGATPCSSGMRRDSRRG